MAKMVENDPRDGDCPRCGRPMETQERGGKLIPACVPVTSPDCWRAFPQDEDGSYVHRSLPIGLLVTAELDS